MKQGVNEDNLIPNRALKMTISRVGLLLWCRSLPVFPHLPDLCRVAASSIQFSERCLSLCLHIDLKIVHHRQRTTFWFLKFSTRERLFSSFQFRKPPGRPHLWRGPWCKGESGRTQTGLSRGPVLGVWDSREERFLFICAVITFAVFYAGNNNLLMGSLIDRFSLTNIY